MRRWLAVGLLILTGCAAGPQLPPVVKAPRTALPSLKDAVAVQAVECAGGTLFRVGFDPTGQETYGLVYYGPVSPDGTPGYPHVWIRFEHRQVVAVLLAIAKDKQQVITLAELTARYRDVCALLGAAA